jgi:fatty acid desaturase
LTLACLSLSFFTVQQAGLMHDSGHRAVFRSKRLNDLLGLANGAAIGMVFANWTARHNTHHAQSNREGMDPDMEVPFIAITKELFQAKDPLQRALGRWQAFYYYPLGCIVGFSNRLGSVSYFLRNRTWKSLFLFGLYLPAVVAFYILPFVFFPLEKATFVFLLVHLSTGVYLANCFAPNHKAMPVVGRDSRMSFIEQQIITSRNVRGGRLTDVILVGLNYQVDHHLFPSCPRNKLPLLRPYVQRACAELGLPYTEASFIETNRLLLRQLRLASRA